MQALFDQPRFYGILDSKARDRRGVYGEVSRNEPLRYSSYVEKTPLCLNGVIRTFKISDRRLRIFHASNLSRGRYRLFATLGTFSIKYGSRASRSNSSSSTDTE